MKVNAKSLLVKLMTLSALLFTCFYMYDFYKCLSGFIANGFREPLVMLPMIIAFFLPVFCFLFFFYDFYVGKINRIVKLAYSVFVIIYAIADLVLIFSNMSLYVSNSALGVYDALPSIIIHFPYDMIVVLIALATLQIFNIFITVKQGTAAEKHIESLKLGGLVRVKIIEYIILSVFAIVIFVFTGASIYAVFSAFSNAFYDPRYIYLILWVLVIPMGNLVLVTLKPEKMNISSRAKLITLGAGIAANLIFGALFAIFEVTSPDFLVHIGKPLFLITFSISMPIEPFIIFGIMVLATVILAIRLILTITKHKGAQQ